MSYPQQVQIFGHTIPVRLHDQPIGVLGDGRYICGQFHIPTDTISLYHSEKYPAIGQANFIHELIEAINAYTDLKLEHHKITTLASGLHQALVSGGMLWQQEPATTVIQ